MSAPAKQNKAESKRARASEGPADPAATSGEEEDRFVRQRIDPSAAMPATAAAASAALPSAVVSRARSFMQLAVVERQLIMQALDLKSLSRLASTCKQMRAESLHPASGCFLRVVKSVSDVSPFSSCNWSFGHDCPLVRAHAHVVARLDEMDSDREAWLRWGTFIHTLSSFRRVVLLSLWNSCSDMSEADALQLIAAVPAVETLWGMRTGTVFAESARVQEAIFRLPHLTRCGLDFAQPGGKFDPSLLTLAPKLWNVVLSLHASDLSPLRLLQSLPHLRRVDFLWTPTSSPVRFPFAVHLPTVEECSFEVEEEDEESEIGWPSVEQLELIVRGMPALRRITLEWSLLVPRLLRSILTLGPRMFPALDWIRLTRTSHFDEALVTEFLAVFPAVEFRVSIQSQADQLSPTLDVRRVTRDADGVEYFSVRRRPAQPAPASQ